ncbi:hypothetical protein SAMN05880582_10323 [Rhizobium sp. RU20A]|uniref:tetratricopeptide repeat protein n=1 Tax=Rhizobium sp. RU20A TaxID=1907412 RepID=UPI00095588DA|nr:tetratricopeptide repeat protein [Rhizobium sp. RU20A]SIQ68648.1 hypothetical protein SAMN05880582_10323 [Rhizobium sp. RU20A]
MFTPKMFATPSRFLRLAAAGTALALVALALPAQAADHALTPAARCDQQAGSVYDKTRNMAFEPVETSDIVVGVALSACREAYRHERSPRITFQLARALHRAGEVGKAMVLLEEAAHAGHALAMVNYGVLLSERGHETDAISLYRSAAEAGNVLALYNLGVAYRDGTGVAADGEEARRWFERAAEAGDEIAAFNIGAMLDEGVQLGENNAEAARYYRIAIAGGSIDAMINLALMLEHGEGIARDIPAAIDLYRKAAERGDEQGKARFNALTAPLPAETAEAGTSAVN